MNSRTVSGRVGAIRCFVGCLFFPLYLVWLAGCSEIDSSGFDTFFLRLEIDSVTFVPFLLQTLFVRCPLRIVSANNQFCYIRFRVTLMVVLL